MAERRLVGIDVARGLALITMMAVHIFPAVDAQGGVAVADRIVSGRAAALFAVLAGVSLVLATRRQPDGSLQTGARRGIAARAAFVALVGLFLGELESGVAVILVYYAVLFLVGCLFLGFGARPLLGFAASWLVVSPVVGHLLRPHLPYGPAPGPTFDSLADPLELVSTLLFTGYYPVLQWTTYLLVGMGLARLPLLRPLTALWLVAVGAVIASAAKLTSALLLGPLGGFDQLTVPPDSVLAGRDLSTVLITGTYGTTPTSTWWWLAVSAPHSGVPLDLLHTVGTSIAIIGGCLLVGNSVRRTLLLIPIAAVGSMTLTLYSVHVAVIAELRSHGPDDFDAPTTLWLLSVAIALVLATGWRFTGRRGPLEAVAHGLSTSARRTT